MASSTLPDSSHNASQIGTDLPTVTTTTKTEFIGYDGKILRSTVDANGKPVRIHKVITTTTTITCYGEELATSNSGRTAEEKFVEQMKELGAETKDVLLHTAVGVQHALESAGDFIKTQLASTTPETTTKTDAKEQTNDLLQQAAALKDVIVQKAIDVKDATVEVIKDLTTPPEEHSMSNTVRFDHGTTTVTTDKKTE